MTENQLNKLKNRLLNIQTQLNGASIVLEKSVWICATVPRNAHTPQITCVR